MGDLNILLSHNCCFWWVVIYHVPAILILTKGAIAKDHLGCLYCLLILQSLLQVPHEVLKLLAVSSNSFVEKLLSMVDNTDPEFGRRTTRKITTLSKFKSSLDSLMKTLSVCDLHYVRCIKPNLRGLTGKQGILICSSPIHTRHSCVMSCAVCIKSKQYIITMFNDSRK